MDNFQVAIAGVKIASKVLDIGDVNAYFLEESYFPNPGINAVFLKENLTIVFNKDWIINRLYIDGTYFSSGAFRDYLLNTDEDRIQKSFKEFNYNILNNNNIRPTIHIIDATKVIVNMYNGNYENASTIKDEDSQRSKGYKLSALYGLYNDQLIHECSHITTLKTHDLVAGKEMLSDFKGFKRGDFDY